MDLWGRKAVAFGSKSRLTRSGLSVILVMIVLTNHNLSEYRLLGDVKSTFEVVSVQHDEMRGQVEGQKSVASASYSSRDRSSRPLMDRKPCRLQARGKNLPFPALPAWRRRIIPVKAQFSAGPRAADGF